MELVLLWPRVHEFLCNLYGIYNKTIWLQVHESNNTNVYCLKPNYEKERLHYRLFQYFLLGVFLDQPLPCYWSILHLINSFNREFNFSLPRMDKQCQARLCQMFLDRWYSYINIHYYLFYLVSTFIYQNILFPQKLVL